MNSSPSISTSGCPDVIPSPALVIPSRARNLHFALRVNSARNLHVQFPRFARDDDYKLAAQLSASGRSNFDFHASSCVRLVSKTGVFGPIVPDDVSVENSSRATECVTPDASR